jgi:DNA mismatch endonuclease, patch repair protein
MDVFTSEKRSLVMSRIRSKNTKPEIQLRKRLFLSGYRYRICYNKVEGKPDIFLLKQKTAIFVNGCFWHGHSCHLFKTPETRTSFWMDKIAGNKKHDSEVLEKLHKNAIRTIVVWECSLKGKTRIGVDKTLFLIEKWLETDSVSLEISGGTDVCC